MHCFCLAIVQNLDYVQLDSQVQSVIKSLNVHTVDIVGRRGLLDASFSPAELREVPQLLQTLFGLLVLRPFFFVSLRLWMGLKRWSIRMS